LWFWDSLNTGSDYVRSKLAYFTNDALGLGVDGLRLDAAKRTFATNADYPSSHLNYVDMSPDDIRAIMGKLSRRPSYISQEIVDTGGSMVGMYTDIGDVQEYKYQIYALHTQY
jgi:alpha-amylase